MSNPIALLFVAYDHLSPIAEEVTPAAAEGVISSSSMYIGSLVTIAVVGLGSLYCLRRAEISAKPAEEKKVPAQVEISLAPHVEEKESPALPVNVSETPSEVEVPLAIPAAKPAEIAPASRRVFFTQAVTSSAKAIGNLVKTLLSLIFVLWSKGRENISLNANKTV